MFIHMFFVNVQSCSVPNACYFWIRYSVIQSRFLSTTPRISCGQISMIFFTRTSIFAWVNNTISPLCINRQLRFCNLAVVIFSLHRRFRCCDFGALAHSAAQIVASQLTPSGTTHCCRLAVITIDYRPHQGDSLSRHRAGSQHRYHPHHRPSCILRAPHPSETHACRSPTTSSRSPLPPSALQPLTDTERRITSKTPSTITASSTTSRRPRVHPAPHHGLLVSALFYRIPHIVHVLR